MIAPRSSGELPPWPDLPNGSQGRLGQDEGSRRADGKRDSPLAAGALALERHDSAEPIRRGEPQSGRRGSHRDPGWPSTLGRSQPLRPGRPGQRRSSAEIAETIARVRGSRGKAGREPLYCDWPNAAGPTPERSRTTIGPSGSSLRNVDGCVACSLTAERTYATAAQVQLAARTGDPDEEKPPLFLDLVAVISNPASGAAGLLPGRR